MPLHHFCIVDVEGGQTGDLVLVPTDDVDDGLSNGRTFDYGGTISLTAGSLLFSRRTVACHFFMNSRVDESGRLRIDPPLCRAGDALTIRLQHDCFVAVTACPASVANGGGGGGPLGVTIGAAVG